MDLFCLMPAGLVASCGLLLAHAAGAVPFCAARKEPKRPHWGSGAPALS